MKRSSNIKYLGYGLVIGMGIASLAGVGLLLLFGNSNARALIPPQTAAPSSTPANTQANTTSTLIPFTATATSTFTPTPTYIYLYTLTPTQTPLPTATLTVGEKKIKSGDLYFTGPLTATEQVQLYNASVTFIAPTTKDSKNIGEQIAGRGYGSPTLICGPLSIAILQRAGILSTSVVPFDFWLLNPFLAKDRGILNRAFPPDEYEHYEFLQSLREFDFAAFPLFPGDFLYVKHGSGGTFDHMLVVNRVDKAGRAYSVTNYNTGQGFIINEVLLYDPLDPNAGIFKKWTRKRNDLEGATGFGGFELWRHVQ